MTEDPVWWWLSFADPCRARGEQFLGACVVGPAVDMKAAIQLSWRLGINPGGSVLGHPLPPAAVDATPAGRVGVLMGREECEALDEIWAAALAGPSS